MDDFVCIVIISNTCVLFLFKHTAELLKEVAETAVTPTKTNTLSAKRNKSKKKLLTKKVSKEPSGKVAEHTHRKNSC